MIFGCFGWYRSGFCGVWVEWNYYTCTAKHFSTLKCKHTPSYYKPYFQCVFCNKYAHWLQVEFLTITRSFQSNRKMIQVFCFCAIGFYLNKCICSKYKCVSMTYSYSFVNVISFWYHFDITQQNYLTLLTNFNTFNNYSTQFSTICWKLKITLLNIKA